MRDHATVDTALREVLPELRRFARWLTRDADSADDLVQSTLERALSRWHTRCDDTAVRAWLYSIAYRRFLDGRRRARRRAAMLELLGQRTEAEYPSAERGAVARSVIKALDQLPEAQRHLLLLVSVEGLSYREVAELFEVPIGTVMSRLSRARTALHQLAEGETSKTPALRLLK